MERNRTLGSNHFIIDPNNKLMQSPGSLYRLYKLKNVFSTQTEEDKEIFKIEGSIIFQKLQGLGGLRFKL